MGGTSLTDVLLAEDAGQVNPERTRVFMAKERHDIGREGDKGYPVRCLRTPQHLYVRNFTPGAGFGSLNRYKEKCFLVKPLMRQLGAQGKLTGAAAEQVRPSCWSSARSSCSVR